MREEKEERECVSLIYAKTTLPLIPLLPLGKFFKGKKQFNLLCKTF